MGAGIGFPQSPKVPIRPDKANSHRVKYIFALLFNHSLTCRRRSPAACPVTVRNLAKSENLSGTIAIQADKSTIACRHIS
jgi:hypothetical protein